MTTRIVTKCPTLTPREALGELFCCFDGCGADHLFAVLRGALDELEAMRASSDYNKTHYERTISDLSMELDKALATARALDKARGK